MRILSEMMRPETKVPCVSDMISGRKPETKAQYLCNYLVLHGTQAYRPLVFHVRRIVDFGKKAYLSVVPANWHDQRSEELLDFRN